VTGIERFHTDVIFTAVLLRCVIFDNKQPR